MKTRILAKFSIATLCVTVCAQAVAAGGFLRWVDDQGNVHYSDTIPPEFAEKGRSRLSSGGIEVEEIAPAKTLEEIQREQELERLRLQQERLIERQRAADMVLLRTFRSVDDLTMVRDGKLQAIDVMIQVTRSNIRRQQQWLAGLRSEAADHERAGKPVTQHLNDSIANTQRAINDSYETIVAREKQKQEIRESFARDLKRFRQLHEIPDVATSESEDVSVSKQLNNLIQCEDRVECDRLWMLAVEYVEEHATVPIQTSTPNLVITAPPEEKGAVALTVSRVNNKDNEGGSIFLDLQCRSAQRSSSPCMTPKATAILEEFRPTLMQASRS